MVVAEADAAYFSLDDCCDDLPGDLRRVADLAMDIAAHPEIDRPNAEHAARTYVSKHLSDALLDDTGRYWHAAAASLVNALFPESAPIDAVYIQSLARVKPTIR